MSSIRDHLSEMVGNGDAESAFATIDEKGVVIEEDGVYLKVSCHPSGAPRTVRLAYDWVGPSFGIYTLPADGDEFLCLFPRDGGIGVAVKQLNTATDKPPSELAALKDKRPVLVIHPNWKLITSDDGIELDAGDNPVIVKGTAIKLGDTSAVELCRKELLDWVTGTLIGTHNAHVHTGNLGAPTTPPIGAPLSGPSGALTTKVKAT